ncbi:hypothetical protein AUC43_15345 [Hymenobacter sedentarius]|uniref:Uncharacterized protein n=1 Tax=Hymenobacter sedentarius TaxID=1411621 RepID=A0A0U4C5M7_9BACT|nr:hypothetical protein [Hymenobacter sedentarius]ALW86338.1 hypothetical protein AUC43_15345 [Hymenobacter sedentarius]
MPVSLNKYRIKDLLALTQEADLINKIFEVESGSGTDQSFKVSFPTVVQTVANNLPGGNNAKVAIKTARCYDATAVNYSPGDETLVGLNPDFLCLFTTCRVEFPHPSTEYLLVYDGTPGAPLQVWRDGDFTGQKIGAKWVPVGSIDAQVQGIVDFSPFAFSYAQDATVKYTLNGQLRLFTAKQELVKATFTPSQIPAPTGLNTDANWQEINAGATSVVRDFLPGSYKKDQVVVFNGTQYRAKQDLVIGDFVNQAGTYDNFPDLDYWQPLNSGGGVSYDDTALTARVLGTENALDALTTTEQAHYTELNNRLNALVSTAPDYVPGSYVKGQFVTNAGNVYIAKQNIANSTAAPTATNVYWLQLGGGSGPATVVEQTLGSNSTTSVPSIKATADALVPKADKTYVDSQNVLKVDKVTGKQLSTEDYTSAEKAKLAGLVSDVPNQNSLAPASATVSPTVDAVNTGLALKVDKIAGKGLSTNDYTTAEQTKLAGLNNAPANQNSLTPASTTLAPTVDAVTGGLSGKVDKVAGKQLSTEDYTTTEKIKLAGLANADVNKAYVDAATATLQTNINAKAADNAVVHLAGTETLTGSKTFSGDLNLSGSATLWLNSGNTLRMSGRMDLRTTDFNASKTHDNTGQHQMYTGTGGHTLTLPQLSGSTYQTFWVENIGTGDLTIATTAPNTILVNNTSVSTALLSPGETLMLVHRSSASTNWVGSYQGGSKPSTVGKVQNALTPASTSLAPSVDATTAGLALKVDAVAGKGLSTNDYTTAEKTKLAGLTNADVTKSYVDTADAALQSQLTALQNTAAVDVYNVSQALREAVVQGTFNDSNELTTAVTGSVSGMRFTYQTYDYEYMPGDLGTLVWVRNYKKGSVTYAGGTGGEAAQNGLSPASATVPPSVDAVNAGLAAKADKTYVDSQDSALQNQITSNTNGLATKADKSYVDAQDTGLQNQITSNTNALTTKVDKVAGMGLSTNDYTTAEKNKLNGLTTVAAGTNIGLDTTTTPGSTIISNTMPAASGTVSGYLTSANWNTFNNKQNAIVNTDALTEGTTNKYYTDARARASVSATAGSALTYNTGTGVFSLPVATTTASGYLSNTDWTTFNSKQNTLAAANGTTNGYLTSTDWTTFNGKQNALSAASGTVSGYLTSADWTTFNGKLGPTTTTTAIGEGTNQYFTTTRVLNTALTGLVTTTSGTPVAADTMLAAWNKVTNFITNITATIRAVTLGTYSKAATQTAIATTDTTPLALGKLEKKADDAIASLANKSDVGHTHTASQVTDFNTAADGRINLMKNVAGGIPQLDASAQIYASLLPIATTTSLGAIKPGTNLTVAADGTLNASGGSIVPATTTTLGGIKVGNGLLVQPDGTLATNGTGGTAYTLPLATPDTLGGVKIGQNLIANPDGTIGVYRVLPRTNYVGVSGTLTASMDNQDQFGYLLAGSILINDNTTFKNDGQKVIFRIAQQGAGSLYSVTWSSAFRFPGGTAPAMTQALSKTDYYGFTWNAGTGFWDCVAITQNL